MQVTFSSGSMNGTLADFCAIWPPSAPPRVTTNEEKVESGEKAGCRTLACPFLLSPLATVSNGGAMT